MCTYVAHWNIFMVIMFLCAWLNKHDLQKIEFSTDGFGEMLAIICKCRSSKK